MWAQWRTNNTRIQQQISDSVNVIMIKVSIHVTLVLSTRIECLHHRTGVIVYAQQTTNRWCELYIKIKIRIARMPPAQCVSVIKKRKKRLNTFLRQIEQLYRHNNTHAPLFSTGFFDFFFHLSSFASRQESYWIGSVSQAF